VKLPCGLASASSPGKELILAHQPDHQHSEALRSLRTELLMRTSSRRGAGIFAFLSPCAKEGRSRLCAELAIAFAQLGSRTLLVDADLRRPHQHELFGAENQIGLAQALDDGSAPRVLRSRRRSADATAHLRCAHIPIRWSCCPAAAIERLVAEWRRSYEFVLIDTPPASEFSDGLPVATRGGQRGGAGGVRTQLRSTY